MTRYLDSSNWKIDADTIIKIKDIQLPSKMREKSEYLKVNIHQDPPLSLLQFYMKLQGQNLLTNKARSRQIISTKADEQAVKVIPSHHGSQQVNNHHGAK